MKHLSGKNYHCSSLVKFLAEHLFNKINNHFHHPLEDGGKMSNQMNKAAQLIHRFPDLIFRVINTPVYRTNKVWQELLVILDQSKKPDDEIFWIKTNNCSLKSLTVN